VTRLSVCILAIVLASTATQAEEDAPYSTNGRVLEVFEKTIRPLFILHCNECHGPESGEGGLRLDSLTAVLRGGGSGAAVVPGDPDRSLLIHAVNHEPSVEAMPPSKRLKSSDIAKLVHWVGMKKDAWPKGNALSSVQPRVDDAEITAKDRSFWAFVAPVEPSVPTPQDREWVMNPIDAFVLAKLEEAGLTPSPQTDQRKLIRRATFDLHGLPPTQREVATFVEDDSPGAFARLIDRLLASPRYGEKWGRHWLDVARYSDSNGMDDNIAWAESWRYRDYVIATFNNDKPYDRFVREQIAGDLIENWSSVNRSESVIATTFLLLGPKMPSADDPIKQQLDIVDEQLDTVGRVFMAVTLGCARCHAHKFDPFSSGDYYALAGIFRSTRSMLGYRVDSKFNLTALGDEVRNAELSRLEQEMDRHDDILVNGNNLELTAEQRKQHTDGLDDAYSRMGQIPAAMAVEDGDIADMSVLLRGNHLTPAQRVARGVPRILSGSVPFRIRSSESGRRELAEWMTDPSHPLTARVMVNRIWCWHFGEGLVRSVDNFGRLGERPGNQPLLDWLALQFIESGWSVKHIHRLIMASSAYRQASGLRSPHKVDPTNRLLWRMNPRRLTAEELRDSLLFLSRQLDLTMGGRTLPIRNHKIMSTAEIEQCNAVHRQPRRTVYLPVIRSGLDEFLKTFDFPDPSVLAGRRSSTMVAPQALFMMNSPLVGNSSRSIAQFLVEPAPVNRRHQIRSTFQLMYARDASQEEIDEWERFIAARQSLSTVSSQQDVEVWESVARVFLSSNEFMYVK
jgi:hypothetical protein